MSQTDPHGASGEEGSEIQYFSTFIIMGRVFLLWRKFSSNSSTQLERAYHSKLHLKVFKLLLMHNSSFACLGLRTRLKELTQRKTILPWLVWLSRFSASQWTKRLLVRFPIRAHAWVAAQVPGWGRGRGSQLMFQKSHITVCLPLFLHPFPSLEK